jgi:hypothetical protein
MLALPYVHALALSANLARVHTSRLPACPTERELTSHARSRACAKGGGGSRVRPFYHAPTSEATASPPVVLNPGTPTEGWGVYGAKVDSKEGHVSPSGVLPLAGYGCTLPCYGVWSVCRLHDMLGSISQHPGAIRRGGVPRHMVRKECSISVKPEIRTEQSRLRAA